MKKGVCSFVGIYGFQAVNHTESHVWFTAEAV